MSLKGDMSLMRDFSEQKRGKTERGSRHQVMGQIRKRKDGEYLGVKLPHGGPLGLQHSGS